MKNEQIRKIAGIGVFTAIVIILQLLGSFIKFGPFSISLVLIPIVVGTALYGPSAGAFLGFIFSLVVLISGDAAAFLAISVPGTVLTVLAKGTLAGWLSGLVYKVFSSKPYPAAVMAAITCPFVNTGIFVLGCFLFFLPTVTAWGEALGFNSTGAYIVFGMIGANFIFELLSNIILSPVIVRVINMGKK